MIIHQIQEFCRSILEACDQINANDSVIDPQIISKVLEVCTAILENVPQQSQREFAKRLSLQCYTINSDSTKTTGSTEDKSTTERTITISETLSEKFQSWKASPETLFEQSSLSLNQGLYAYIDLAEEADAVKDIRLRFTKWIFYRCRESWGHNGKRNFFQRLRNDGTDVDERKCSRWLHEGKAYDVFVMTWGIGVLLIIPITSTEAERFPLTETSNNGRNDNKREAALNNLKERGIKQAADTCHEVSKALASHLLNDEKLVSLFNKGTYPTILTLERKPPQRPTTTMIQQLKKKRKRTDAEDTRTSLGGSSEQTSGPGATVSQPFPTTSVSDDDEGRSHLRQTSSQEPRTSSQEPRTASQEPRTASQEPQTASQEPRTAEATGLPTPLDIRDLQTGAPANSIPLPERDNGGEISNQADRFGQRRLSQVTPTNRAGHGRSSPLQNASLDTGSMASSSSATIESTISQRIQHSASNGLSVQSTFNNSRANQTPSRSDIKNNHQQPPQASTSSSPYDSRESIQPDNRAETTHPLIVPPDNTRRSSLPSPNQPQPNDNLSSHPSTNPIGGASFPTVDDTGFQGHGLHETPMVIGQIEDFAERDPAHEYGFMDARDSTETQSQGEDFRPPSPALRRAPAQQDQPPQNPDPSSNKAPLENSPREPLDHNTDTSANNHGRSITSSVQKNINGQAQIQLLGFPPGYPESSQSLSGVESREEADTARNHTSPRSIPNTNVAQTPESELDDQYWRDIIDLSNRTSEVGTGTIFQGLGEGLLEGFDFDNTSYPMVFQ